MTKFRPLIEQTAKGLSLDPNLVEAVVIHESSANPWAWNPEPQYQYLWDVRHTRPFRTLSFAERASEAPPVDFPSLAGDRDQEWWGQQASWGLMQVMGAVGREHGFMLPFLTELCDPETNLALGCKHLAHLLTWSHGGANLALAAYNAGIGGSKSSAGTTYASNVMAVYKSVELAHPGGQG